MTVRAYVRTVPAMAAAMLAKRSAKVGVRVEALHR
jgi:hypothetical protein